MNSLHIHDVLRMMEKTQKTYTGKEDYIKDITEKFGADVQFFACSESEMNINDSYDFLIKKGKIIINDTKVELDPDMTMCDEDNHDHDHHH